MVILDPAGCQTPTRAFASDWVEVLVPGSFQMRVQRLGTVSARRNYDASIAIYTHRHSNSHCATAAC